MTLYIGMTNDLVRRIWEHRNKVIAGFAADYWLSVLLHHETYPDARSAIAREKQRKGWRREKKVKLIESMNPHWEDLSELWMEFDGGEVRGPSTPLRSAQDDGGRDAAAR